MAKHGLRPTDELISLAMEGNGMAFTELWDTYIESLRAYIKGTMKVMDDFYVDDICSKSFEKAFRQIASYDPSKSQFLTWLRTIAHNTALDIIDAETRANKRYVALESDFSDDIDTPLESIIKDEDEESLQRYIDGLPDLYREIARMRLIDGLQYKEIADELDMEMNTVRTRIRRAKAMIDKMKA